MLDFPLPRHESNDPKIVSSSKLISTHPLLPPPRWLEGHRLRQAPHHPPHRPDLAVPEAILGELADVIESRGVHLQDLEHVRVGG